MKNWYYGTDNDLKAHELGVSLEWSIVELVHECSAFSLAIKKEIFEK